MRVLVAHGHFSVPKGPNKDMACSANFTSCFQLYYLVYLFRTLSPSEFNALVEEDVRNTDLHTIIAKLNSCTISFFFLPRIVLIQTTFEFFTIGQSDAFLSDYLTDLKLHKTK